MEATLSPEMNGCVTQITSHLLKLERDQQIIVLSQVNDRLEDLRALEIWERIKTGEEQTVDHDKMMATLRERYDL
jgi:hypothetical protein